MISYISDESDFYVNQIQDRVSVGEVKEVPSDMLFAMANEIKRLNKIALDRDTEISRLQVKLSKIEKARMDEEFKLHAAIGRLNIANQLRESTIAYNTLEVYKGK